MASITFTPVSPLCFDIDIAGVLVNGQYENCTFRVGHSGGSGLNYMEELAPTGSSALVRMSSGVDLFCEDKYQVTTTSAGEGKFAVGEAKIRKGRIVPVYEWVTTTYKFHQRYVCDGWYDDMGEYKYFDLHSRWRATHYSNIPEGGVGSSWVWYFVLEYVYPPAVSASTSDHWTIDGYDGWGRWFEDIIDIGIGNDPHDPTLHWDGVWWRSVDNYGMAYVGMTIAEHRTYSTLVYREENGYSTWVPYGDSSEIVVTGETSPDDYTVWPDGITTREQAGVDLRRGVRFTVGSFSDYYRLYNMRTYEETGTRIEWQAAEYRPALIVDDRAFFPYTENPEDIDDITWDIKITKKQTF